MSRRLIVRAALVVLLAIGLTAATAIGSTGIRRVKKRSGFSLAGHVDGLLPGEHRLLVITASNRGRTPLLVRSVVTKVRAPSPKCTGGNLHVARFRGRLRLKAAIAAHRRERVDVAREPVGVSGSDLPALLPGPCNSRLGERTKRREGLAIHHRSMRGLAARGLGPAPFKVVLVLRTNQKKRLRGTAPTGAAGQRLSAANRRSW